MVIDNVMYWSRKCSEVGCVCKDSYYTRRWMRTEIKQTDITVITLSSISFLLFLHCFPTLLVIIFKFRREVQGRIQEFQNRGARSRRGRILGSGVCFDVPSHIPYVFVVSVVDNIHIVNIVCWPKSKYMRVIQSKCTKTNPYTGWTISFQHCWNSAETMLKHKNTYGFRIVSVLKFQVSASFRNAES